MRYVALIYTDQAQDAKMTEAENEAVYADYTAFGEEAGKMAESLTGEALHPADTAKTVTVRDGKMITVDGPFAETKEQLGGFYLIDCKDMDEAIAIAAKIPSAKHGRIEVRPTVDFG
jgi:hypothetical protein